MQLQLEASQLSVDEILVARRAIECAVVEVGARNRDEFDLDEMQALLKVAAKAEASNDVDSFVKADLGFHELLGQCTHNQLLQEVQTQITRVHCRRTRYCIDYPRRNGRRSALSR